jgi:Uma2 family endonuclease
MSTALKRRLLNEEEYLLVERQANQRSEFCGGEMFAMAGASDAHETISGNCFGLLWQQLRSRGCGIYKSDMKVRVSTGRYTYPDVAAVCGERKFADEKKDVLLNPTVIIEVLSDSTAAHDRGDKASDYRLLPSLRELLIVEQSRPQVDCYVRSDANTWTWISVQGLEASIDLLSVDCSLRLGDVFAGVDFPAAARPALRVAGDGTT